ncbi:hypothetical protein BN381_360052 [Candidatus Microthrix parvicella RN1]|uniref:Uncharacterized protein n=1 Tax=Candidatus Neomicrothrix parvicella RN1 TaxID=1229780 RepID=R4Z123_9ACTN|nr:hypothetical protein BN381_360052 [Candidatus Microthrix parvicella RN1]
MAPDESSDSEKNTPAAWIVSCAIWRFLHTTSGMGTFGGSVVGRAVAGAAVAGAAVVVGGVAGAAAAPQVSPSGIRIVGFGPCSGSSFRSNRGGRSDREGNVTKCPTARSAQGAR